MSSGLGPRLATAAVLVPGVVLAVLFLPRWAFAGLVSVIMLAAWWEWTRLSRLPGRPLRGLATLALAVGFLGLALLPLDRLREVAAIALVFWIGAALWLSRPQFAAVDSVAARALKLACGALLLAGAWAGAVYLRDGLPRGAFWLLGCLAVVYGADSFAYFAGRRFGGRKMAPRISPGKTWAGFAGALAGSLPMALAVAALLRLPLPRWPAWLALALACVLLSIVGDLFESLMKRHCQVKDSGRLFPGHGGVLDRGDSLFAALPAFAVGLGWLLS